jgi:hypothetical protein
MMTMSPPRYFEGEVRKGGADYFKDADKPRRANWKQHEKDIAKRSGDRQVAGSGNQPGKPGDVSGTKYLRDGKATVGAGITLQANFFRKLVAESLAMGKVPVIEIRLEGAVIPVPRDWVCLPASDFEELVTDAWQT